ncbi:MAG TPA: hypothetical protein VMR73_00285 [Candidatus Paceibacterota bacterium]|nr:hypothetical protein [Candidatus Paceibacterota bacterium]
METLSPQALAVIEKYLRLPLGCGCQTPYFNNRRKRVRGGLRALVGKGTPEEIAEEGGILAVKDRVSIKNMNDETLKKFLVDENLGIDCSGFAYHILDAEAQTRINKKLRAIIKPYKGLERKIIYLFRPAENSDVTTISHEKNSAEIKASDAKPGDFISILESEISRNHIMIIEKVAKENENIILYYAHSIALPEEGVYGHGVRRGKISFNKNQNIVDGIWEEMTKENLGKTMQSISKRAKVFSLRRLRAFCI